MRLFIVYIVSDVLCALQVTELLYATQCNLYIHEEHTHNNQGHYRNSCNMFNPVLISLCCYKCHYINRITPFTAVFVARLGFKCRWFLSSLSASSSASFYTQCYIYIFPTTSSCSKCCFFFSVLLFVIVFSRVLFCVRSWTTIIIVQRSVAELHRCYKCKKEKKTTKMHSRRYFEIFFFFFKIYWSRDVVALNATVFNFYLFFSQRMSSYKNRYTLTKNRVQSIYVTDKRCQHTIDTIFNSLTF